MVRAASGDYDALTPSQLTSPDERANAIFGGTFNTASLTNNSEYPDNLLAPPNDSATHKPNLIEKADQKAENRAVYPKMDNAGVRVGFFLDDQSFTKSGSPHLLTNVPENQSADSNAVLFEIPEQKPLSIFQYRHANLNTYLHGPSYALGNSYASTQVARHRSWGRVQTIQHEPTK